MGWFFIPGTNSFENVEANWILGVSPLSFGAIGAVINFIVAIAVSAMGNPPPKEVQDLVESVRYPKVQAVQSTTNLPSYKNRSEFWAIF